MKNSVLDDLKFLRDEFPQFLENSVKPTRWYKCRVCSEQFAHRRLLEAHKKLSVCGKAKGVQK